MLPIAPVAAVDRLLETPLELAAVDESRERIVSRLVGHLPGETAELGDVVQQHDRADELL